LGGDRLEPGRNRVKNEVLDPETDTDDEPEPEPDQEPITAPEPDALPEEPDLDPPDLAASPRMSRPDDSGESASRGPSR
jgi:hypothetical protein